MAGSEGARNAGAARAADAPANAGLEGAAVTPLAFDILLALADEDRHGYAILLDIADRSAGRTRPHAGTLYRAIARLVEAGLVAELDERPDPDGDERRRYYRLTASGRRVAVAEATRLERQVREARTRKLLQRPGTS